MFSPISSAAPLLCTSKTRLLVEVLPLASSTTLPGTSASMIMARSMQRADPVHMSLLNSYLPSATVILSTPLSLTAAVSSATVLTAASVKCRPCRGDQTHVRISRPSGVGAAVDGGEELDVREKLHAAIVPEIDGADEPAEVVVRIVVHRVDSMHKVVACGARGKGGGALAAGGATDVVTSHPHDPIARLDHVP